MAELLGNVTGTAKTPSSMSAKDIANGLLGSNIRSGTGLALLDSAIEAGTTAASRRDVAPFLKRLAGKYVGRLTVPFAQLRDAYDEVLSGVSAAREKAPEGREFFGPIIANLPALSRTLPEVVSPTQGGPLLTEHPFLLKQLTDAERGVAVSEVMSKLRRVARARAALDPDEGMRLRVRRLSARKRGLLQERGLLNDLLP